MEENIVNSQEGATQETVSESIVSGDEMSMEDIDKEEEETTEQETTEADKKEEDSSEKVLSSIAELSEKIDGMNALFVQKIQHTTHEEKIVDQMHAELQKYKDDMYAQLVRPILLDIIEIRDSILRMSKTYAAKSEEEQNVPLKVFSDYAYDVQDILEKNSISIYAGKEGDPFTPIKQRIIKKVSTSVEELHGKIAESLSSGYDYLGKTISPEKVVVYVYEKDESEKGDNQ